ncbi:MAG: sulfatase [Planctomycetota bacterium]|nr:MAG: sulfatase [Planctomycetota bacterium]
MRQKYGTRRGGIVVLLACVTTALVVSTGTAAEPKRPNVLIVVSDDQGYGDLAAHGNPVIDTPNLDALHDVAVRLTNFHVDPTCAPTRSALMTGKYSHHVGVWHTIQGGNHLRRGEVTMAEVFRHNGYQTGMFGKWHLGANYPYRPMDRGFDEWLGCGDGGVGTSDDYFWNDRVNDHYWHNGEREYRPGFNPDVFFDATMEYIRRRDPKRPFFVYLATYVPHQPCTLPRPDLHRKYLDRGLSPQVAGFYASIERFDWNMGRLRRFLQEQRLDRDTLLIFLTDNGTAGGRNVFNAGMSGAKGGLVDGGHRVPCFVYWPEGNLGPARDIDTLTAHIDWLPTLVELCGLELPRPIDFDGMSLAGLLRGTQRKWPDRCLVVERQRRYERTPEASAVMTQRWRLVGLKKLYDIENDPAQQVDVAAEHPDVVARLKEAFARYWERVTPQDREPPLPIVGSDADEEIYLGLSELRQGGYSHGHVASGVRAEGVWYLEVARAGRYEFEVRRWAAECDAPLAGVPDTKKTVDAWTALGPVTGLLYDADFVKLPVASVALRIGDRRWTQPVDESATRVVFQVDLEPGVVEVDADLLDGNGKTLTNAYYVYVRRDEQRNSQ